MQPSRLEAVSRTIVIANGGGPVVSYHCERSDAGLLYDDEYELEECLAFVADSPDAASRIAASGREYVLQNYTWDHVLDTIETRLLELTS